MSRNFWIIFIVSAISSRCIVHGQFSEVATCNLQRDGSDDWAYVDDPINDRDFDLVYVFCHNGIWMQYNQGMVVDDGARKISTMDFDSNLMFFTFDFLNDCFNFIFIWWNFIITSINVIFSKPIIVYFWW